MYCFKCGREIGENDQKCPYCGEIQVQNIKGQYPDKSKEYNIFAIFALLCSLSFFVFGLHILSGVGAIILAIIALNQIKKEGSRGKGIAIAAIIIAIIEIIIAIIFSTIFLHLFFDIFHLVDDFDVHYSPYFDGIYY